MKGSKPQGLWVIDKGNEGSLMGKWHGNGKEVRSEWNRMEWGSKCKVKAKEKGNHNTHDFSVLYWRGIHPSLCLSLPFTNCFWHWPSNQNSDVTNCYTRKNAMNGLDQLSRRKWNTIQPNNSWRRLIQGINRINGGNVMILQLHVLDAPFSFLNYYLHAFTFDCFKNRCLPFPFHFNFNMLPPSSFHTCLYLDCYTCFPCFIHEDY